MAQHPAKREAVAPEQPVKRPLAGAVKRTLPRLAGSRPKKREHSIGVSVRESTPETSMARLRVTANS